LGVVDAPRDTAFSPVPGGVVDDSMGIALSPVDGGVPQIHTPQPGGKVGGAAVDSAGVSAGAPAVVVSGFGPAGVVVLMERRWGVELSDSVVVGPPGVSVGPAVVEGPGVVGPDVVVLVNLYGR